MCNTSYNLMSTVMRGQLNGLLKILIDREQARIWEIWIQTEMHS